MRMCMVDSSSIFGCFKALATLFSGVRYWQNTQGHSEIQILSFGYRRWTSYYVFKLNWHRCQGMMKRREVKIYNVVIVLRNAT